MSHPIAIAILEVAGELAGKVAKMPVLPLPAQVAVTGVASLLSTIAREMRDHDQTIDELLIRLRSVKRPRELDPSWTGDELKGK